MRDMWAISWDLGIEVTRNQANRMLRDLEIEKCKSAKVTMDSGTEMIQRQYKSKDYKATKQEI